MNAPTIMCRRCGHGYRDLLRAVFGVAPDRSVEPRCQDKATCDFRAFGRVLRDATTILFLRPDRGEFVMRRDGRTYDRYTEYAR